MSVNNQKPGVMLYFDLWKAPMKILNGEQVKELLNGVLNLAQDRKYPDEFSCIEVDAFFDSMVSSILKDDEQYTKKVEQCKKAGLASVNARQRQLTDVNERQRQLTDVNERQRTSTNTIQPNLIQSNTIQSNIIQPNTVQSSTNIKEPYWGDNKLWEERCIHCGVDPYDPEQKAIYDREWNFQQENDDEPLAF